MKNIAAELMRASSIGIHSEHAGEEAIAAAYERALTLINASLEDKKWKDETEKLYTLRNAIAALYAEKSHPAISYYIAHELMGV